jgi:hypothetical protein
MDTPRRRLGDRRSRRRFEIVGQLWGALETIESLRMRNVSTGGALLESRFALAVDSVHRVRLAAEDQGCDVQARVRHVEQVPGPTPRFAIGLEFIAPADDASAHIETLMRRSGTASLEPAR